MPNRARTADSIDAHVAARILERRQALGLSQSALAERLGVSFQQLQKYEAGQNRVSASRLHRLSAVLGCGVETFFPPMGAEAGPREPLDPLSRVPDPQVRRALRELVEVLAA